MASKELTEQEIKANAKQNISAHAFHMKHCLDEGKLMDGLKHASEMLGELRVSALGPKEYYELYILAFEHLRFLEAFLYDEATKKERKVSELYELVQYAGNIIPRLYLIITVGSVYVKCKEAPAKDVLKDLVEMCKGIQHPTRGLFLRSYLSEMTKDKLPDEGSEYAGDKGGNIKDCIDFVVQNFVEMNKLWVRMQHQGSVREREKRELERKELGPLIGKMLSRLSNLEGLTPTLYASHVLPVLMEQISTCKDPIAQEYLMECMVQVFPDEYHLLTLSTVLETASSLVEGVDVKSIVVNLTDRLVNFVKSNREKLSSIKGPDMFDTFYLAISRITQERKTMPAEDVLALYKSLMDLTIQVYPKSLENVDKIFSVAAPVLMAKRGGEGGASLINNQRVVKGIMALLHSPLENYHNILTVLALQNYPGLFDFLSNKDRRKAALDVVKSVIDDGVLIPTPEHTEALLRLITPLIVDPKEEEQTDDDDEDDPVGFAEEQNLVGSLVHLFRCKDPASEFEILMIVRKYFGMGGKLRIRHSVPPLVFRAIEVARGLRLNLQSQPAVWEDKGQRVFKFLLGTTKTFVELVKLPELSFRLLLQCAQSASENGFQAVSYQFMEKAYMVYEQEISDSVAQFNAMNLLIPTLGTLTLSDEDTVTLLTKTALLSSRLVKKHDQCILVSLVSHLFWKTQDGARVMECMQRAVRIASGMAEAQASLFASILSEYLYFYAAGNDQVTVQVLNAILELAGLKHSEGGEDMDHLYVNTLKHLARMKKENPEKYGALKV